MLSGYVGIPGLLSYATFLRILSMEVPGWLDIISIVNSIFESTC